MKSHMILIILGVCLILSLMVTFRVLNPSSEPGTTQTTLPPLTDTVGKSIYSTLTTNPSVQITLSGDNGIITVSAGSELMHKLGRISAGDTVTELKEIFGINPREINDSTGAFSHYAYYCGTVEIDIYGRQANRVVATDFNSATGGIIFESDFS